MVASNLREIAQNSAFSHGVHYYFSDKVDLLTHSVRWDEEVCVTRYASSSPRPRRPTSLSTTSPPRWPTPSAPTHRLWYDLRNQSLFEESFRADVFDIDGRREQMIWRVVEKYADLAGIELTVAARTAYGILDGLFQQFLLRYLAGEQQAADELAATVERTLDMLVPHTYLDDYLLTPACGPG